MKEHRLLLVRYKTVLLAVFGFILLFVSLIFGHKGDDLIHLIIKLMGEIGGLFMTVSVLHALFEQDVKEEMLKEISENVLSNENLRRSGICDFQEDASHVDKISRKHFEKTNKLIIGANYSESFYKRKLPILAERCKNGRQTTILLLKADSSAANYLSSAAYYLSENGEPHVKEKVDNILTILKKFNENNSLDIRQYSIVLRYSFIATEEYMWLTFFTNTGNARSLPALKVTADSPLYNVFMKDIEELIAKSEIFS